MKPHEDKERSFDSFCRQIIKNETRDFYRQANYRREHEIPFSELPEETLSKLAVWNKYFEDGQFFDVIGFKVMIESDTLSEALRTLSEDKRNIILLSYFLSMTDKEIARHLNLIRRTVSYRRTSTLKALRQMMEGC